MIRNTHKSGDNKNFVKFSRWSTSCIRLNLLTTKQQQKRWCQRWPILFGVLDPCSRRVEGGCVCVCVGRTCSCLQWLWPMVLSCIPQLGTHVKIASLTAALTSGRHNALPCISPTSCSVSCFINHTLPVMFQSCFSHAHLAAGPLTHPFLCPVNLSFLSFFLYQKQKHFCVHHEPKEHRRKTLVQHTSTSW